MIGNFHRQETGENSAVFQLSPDGFKDGCIAGKGDGRGTVDGGERNLGGVRMNQRGRIGLGECDGEHAALAGGGLVQPAAMKTNADGVFESERAGSVVSEHFTRTVTGDQVGNDASREQQLGERHLNGKDAALGKAGFVNASCGLVAIQFFEETPFPGVFAEERIAFLQRLAKNGLGLEQIETHSAPLRAHAGVDECDLVAGIPVGPVARRTRCFGALKHGVEGS